MKEGAPLEIDFSGKRVFITGHTSKAGLEFSKKLVSFGAKVYGFSLPFASEEKDVKGSVNILGDIRNRDSLSTALQVANPEMIFHFAKAKSEKTPSEIFETDVMGAVNLLELSTELENLKQITMVENKDETAKSVNSASQKAAHIVAKAYEPLLKERNVQLLSVEFAEIEGLFKL